MIAMFRIAYFKNVIYLLPIKSLLIYFSKLHVWHLNCFSLYECDHGLTSQSIH
jgi:hypothetical protein